MPPMTTTTHVYKDLGGLCLSVDIHTPESFNSEDGTVLIHFHKGYLIFGEKTTFPPNWLINACHQRGWAYATPSYRLLPETNAVDIVQDAVDATVWVRNHVSKSGPLIVAGSSAGGYLALATAAHPATPPVMALLSVYGMLDPAARRYVQPGQAMAAPVENLDVVVKEIYAATESVATDGYPFPANPAADKRFTWMKALHEAALFPDLMTGIRGLAQQINREGTEAIPERFRFLFPATFGLSASFPPTILVHGTDDTAVDIEYSRDVVRQLQAFGVKAHLEAVNGQGHGFDVRGIPGDVDVFRDHDAAGFYSSLAKAITFLEQAVQIK